MIVGSLSLPYHCRYKVGSRWFDYYRRNGHRTRLPDQSNPFFYAAYQAAHELAETVSCQKPAVARSLTPGSMAALIAAYRASPEWRQLAPASKADYDKALNVLEGLRYGHLPVATIPRQFVKKLRNDHATAPAYTKHKVPQPILDQAGNQVVRATPRRANRMVNVLRLLLAWAIDQGDWFRKDKPNPAARPGQLRTGQGYKRWSPEDVATFLASKHVSEPLKRAAALGFYTGQRKQDCLAMTRSARKRGVIEVVPEKTRNSTAMRLRIPEHPALTAILDAAPPSDALTVLTRADGKPWGEHHFNHAFADATKAAGLTGLTFHGLRKGASATLAEAGCTDAEIDSILGHADPRMTRLYRQQADQALRAKAAITKLTRQRK